MGIFVRSQHTPHPRNSTTHIRWMILRDLPDVQEIDLATFDQPWRMHHFRSYLRRRFHVGLTGIWRDVIAGYLLYEPAADCYIVSRLAVDPYMRGNGIGTTLIERLKTRCGSNRRGIVMLVPLMELDTLEFLRRRGFKAEVCFEDAETSMDVLSMEWHR